MIRWVCQQDLPQAMNNWHIMAAPFWTGDPTHMMESPCGGSLQQRGEGRKGSQGDWPKCPNCGKTMLPFEEVGAGSRPASFHYPDE